MSIRVDLRGLVDLQMLELDLRALDREIAALPAERAALESEVQAGETQVAAAETELEESARRRRSLEGELADAERHMEKEREKEYQVKTNQALWALQEEIAQAQQRIDELEEQILEQMETADATAALITQRGEELEHIRQRVDAALAALDARQADLEGRREQLRHDITAACTSIDSTLLALYERVKAVRDGVGVAEALDETCRACNFRLRPQLYLEVINMERAGQCYNCKRILFNREALELPSSVEIAASA